MDKLRQKPNCVILNFQNAEINMYISLSSRKIPGSEIINYII